MISRLDRSRALAGALLCAASLASAESSAGPILLDEPPRLYTFKLDDPSSSSSKLSLLRAYQNAEVERPGPVRRYLGGPWGVWGSEPWRKLTWSGVTSTVDAGDAGDAGDAARAEERAEASDDGEPVRLEAAARAGLFGFEPSAQAIDLRLAPDASVTWLAQIDPDWTPSALISTGLTFASNGFDALWAAPKKPVVDWRCRRRPVSFMRWGNETAAFELVRCDGSVAPNALDHLSIMARPPEAEGPGEGKLLPDEPQPMAWEKGEWMPHLKVVHPRLLWVLQKIADAFPWREIYIFSGYRPRTKKGGAHHSLHSDARAMDISVTGVANVSLLELCRKLDDVGCGFYPNSRFVHVDVRRPGTGHAFWIDASGPGEPSRYVDSWPGVVLSGGMAWDGRRMADQETPQEGGVPTSSVCSSGPRGDRTK